MRRKLTSSCRGLEPLRKPLASLFRPWMAGPSSSPKALTALEVGKEGTIKQERKTKTGRDKANPFYPPSPKTSEIRVWCGSKKKNVLFS